MFQVAIYFYPGHPYKKCLLSQETRRVILNRTEPLFFGFNLIPMSFGFGKQYGQRSTNADPAPPPQLSIKSTLIEQQNNHYLLTHGLSLSISEQRRATNEWPKER